MSLKACSRSEIRECSAQKKAKVDTIRERDRISELSDDILCTILSSLPTRNSVGTSTLSKRWRNVWTSVPVININSYSLWCEYHEEDERRRSGSIGLPFENWLKNFVDRLIPNYETCWLRTLRICCYTANDWSNVGNWIGVVTGLDELEELDLMFWEDHVLKLPPSTFTCKKLVILKLAEKVVLNFPLSVCLPSLKELHLLSVKNLDVDSVTNFLTGCPVLEVLRIKSCWHDKLRMKTLYVQSSSLKSLTLISWDYQLLKLVIDASNLERLNLFGNGEKQFDVNCSLSSLVTVKLDIRPICYTPLKGRDIFEINVLELVMKMCNTKYLCLYAGTMMCLELRGLDYLPMFKNLKHLRVGTSYSSLPFLPCLLECCPNLTHFSLFKGEYRGLQLHGPHQQSRTPKCLMLYLEKIELHIFEGYENEMEMVSYFLKTPALKKMSITFGKPEELFNFQGKVLKLPKASPTCEIDVIGF